MAAFRPFYTLSYYYAELLMLDAGSWFNESSLEQARPTFKATENGRFENGHIVYSNGLYISAIQDQIAYAQGKRLIRDANGRRILTYKVKDEYKRRFVGYKYSHVMKVEFESDDLLLGKILLAVQAQDLLSVLGQPRTIEVQQIVELNPFFHVGHRPRLRK